MKEFKRLVVNLLNFRLGECKVCGHRQWGFTNITCERCNKRY